MQCVKQFLQATEAQFKIRGSCLAGQTHFKPVRLRLNGLSTGDETSAKHVVKS